MQARADLLCEEGSIRARARTRQLLVRLGFFTQASFKLAATSLLALLTKGSGGRFLYSSSWRMLGGGVALLLLVRCEGGAKQATADGANPQVRIEQ